VTGFFFVQTLTPYTMGKQIKTGVYQFNAFQEMEAIRQLRIEAQGIIRQELFYGEKWSSEKKAEVAARLAEIAEIIELLKG
jgi:hypothetical protein